VKIMIVDDNARMRRTIRETLSELQAEICECGDATEAITTYSYFRPDWVLMDVMMEPMDGISATRAIITIDPKARVIIVTQHDEERLKIAAHEVGAIGFVLKENLSEVARMVSRPV